jgi:flagellar biosynthesis regulator FlaF
MTQNASHAYARTARTGLSGRALEATLLVQTANRLAKASQAPGDQAELIAALGHNQKVWAIFARALRHGDTDLPEPERERLQATVDFVALRTYDILQRLPEFDPGKAIGLIEVNRTLAAGLAGQPGTRAA